MRWSSGSAKEIFCNDVQELTCSIFSLPNLGLYQDLVVRFLAGLMTATTAALFLMRFSTLPKLSVTP
jgi:hypothetical protein